MTPPTRPTLATLPNQYRDALTTCSRLLLQAAPTQNEQIYVAGEALEVLRGTSQAKRAYLFQNKRNAEEKLCVHVLAEATAVGQMPIQGPALSQTFCWDCFTETSKTALAHGHALSGSLESMLLAESPLLTQLRDTHGIRSLLLLPLYLNGSWWGALGLDDKDATRLWSEDTKMCLYLAADMFEQTLVRWQIARQLTRQNEHQRVLAQFAEALLVSAETEEAIQTVIATALEQLRTAVDACRAQLFCNYSHDVPHDHFGMVVDTHRSGVVPQLPNLNNHYVAWNELPNDMYEALAGGQTYGGPITQTFASKPTLLNLFLEQKAPLFSVLCVPVQVDGQWWGFISLDDTLTPRQWDDGEADLLRTAADILASNIMRWEAEAEARGIKEKLEYLVEHRTRELAHTNKRLQEEAGQRQEIQDSLAQRLELEQTLTKVSTSLLHQGQAAMASTLRDIGQAVYAERVFLIFFGPDDEGPQRFNDVEWFAPNLDPLNPTTAVTFAQECLWLKEEIAADFQTRQGVFMMSRDDLPPEANRDRQFLTKVGIQTLAVFPMILSPETTAVLACTNFESRPREESQRILQLLSNLVESTLQKEATLVSLENRIVDRTRELTTLFEVMMLTSEANELSEMLEPFMDHVARVGQADALCIHLLDTESNDLILVAQQGLDTGHAAHVAQIPAHVLTYVQGRDLSGAWPDLPAELGQIMSPPGSPFASYFGSPLRTRGEAAGLLSVYRVSKKMLPLTLISTLSVLAEQLGIAVENHRLRQNARDVAVLAERQRLARELHDSIAQALYSQSLFTRATTYALEDGQLQNVADNLAQLESMARNTLREMRLLLFQLRPQVWEETSLVDAIEHRLNEVERRLGITAVLETDSLPELTNEQTTALYRVLMEALNNSLKHAEAESVGVSMRLDQEQQLIIQVQDDGCGFDDQAPASGQGLNNMRTRIATIAGQLFIDTAVGTGTTISIFLPYHGEDS